MQIEKKTSPDGSFVYDELVMQVTTYNALLHPEAVEKDELPEYEEKGTTVRVHNSNGVKIILGTDDHEKNEYAPDVQIERQPNGWMVQLTSVGGGDPACYVFMHDDGRTFLVREFERPWAAFAEVESLKDVPGFGHVEENSNA